MFALPGPTQSLLLLQALGVAGVLARLVFSGLFRTYRFFTGYLIAVGAQMAAPWIWNESSPAYFRAYLTTESVLLCFYALVVMELYSLVLKGQPGIATVAKRYVCFGLAGAVFLSLLLVEWEQAPGQYLERFLIVERTIVSSILFFLLSITAFLAYYPVRLTRNTVFYSIGYAIYFTCKAAALFVWNQRRNTEALDHLALAISTACLLFWAVVLSWEGEAKTTVVGHRWAPGDDERLLRQLESLNASLVRVRE